MPMPIYCVIGYSPVPGDCCYVEAPTGAEAAIIVADALHDEEIEIAIAEWETLECPAPFFLLLHRD